MICAMVLAAMVTVVGTGREGEMKKIVTEYRVPRAVRRYGPDGGLILHA